MIRILNWYYFVIVAICLPFHVFHGGFRVEYGSVEEGSILGVEILQQNLWPLACNKHQVNTRTKKTDLVLGKMLRITV